MTQTLNNTVYATLAPSTTHGIGVFAIRDIPKGTKYTDYTNETLDRIETYNLSHTEFEAIHPAIKKLILDRTIFVGTQIKFTSPNTDAVLRSFMNHSTKPNTDGIVALRDISTGEELTENYFELTDNMSDLTLQHMGSLL